MVRSTCVDGTRPDPPPDQEDTMRKRIILPVLSTLAVAASLLVAVPAGAHGYISSPPSRQADCAQGRVADCGDITWEPQSVEAPKGSLQCNGGGSRFAVLNDGTR